jgi:drug/metabolite transporter (DMT)-like permease
MVILVRRLHSENALSPIDVTPSGMVILVRLLHPENALFPIEVTLSGMIMLVRFWHPENALSPIEVTLSGMIMLVRFWHPENALSPIEVTLEGMVMFLRLKHPSNALFPIEVTLEGMIMLVGPNDPVLNASSPIMVIPLGMVTCLAFPLYLTSTVPSMTKFLLSTITLPRSWFELKCEHDLHRIRLRINIIKIKCLFIRFSIFKKYNFSKD